MINVDHDSRVVRTQGQPGCRATTPSLPSTSAKSSSAQRSRPSHRTSATSKRWSAPRNASFAVLGQGDPDVVLADAGYWHQRQMQQIASESIHVLMPPDAGLRKAHNQTLPTPRQNRVSKRMATDRGDAQPAQAPQQPTRRRETMSADGGDRRLRCRRDQPPRPLHPQPPALPDSLDEMEQPVPGSRECPVARKAALCDCGLETDVAGQMHL